MRIRTSYHTHSRWCDGEGEIAEYAQAALDAGLDALGVSSHSPLLWPDENALPAVHLPAYCAEVLRLRDRHAGRLHVHLGLEFDYVPEHLDDLWAIVAPHPFDYLIGSVHFIGHDTGGVPWAYDLTRRGFEHGLRDLFGGDIRALVGAYYQRVRGLAAWTQAAGNRIAVAGHLDRIKLWNRGDRYFSEKDRWYRDQIEQTLDACRSAGLIVEINTNGWRGGPGAPYPSPWIVRRCVEMEIPLVVTTDAHAPQRVTDFHAEAEALLREVGCTRLAMLRDGRWKLKGQ